MHTAVVWNFTETFSWGYYERIVLRVHLLLKNYTGSSGGCSIQVLPALAAGSRVVKAFPRQAEIQKEDLLM